MTFSPAAGSWKTHAGASGAMGGVLWHPDASAVTFAAPRDARPGVAVRTCVLEAPARCRTHFRGGKDLLLLAVVD